MATVRLQSRRDTLANWTTHNPILGSGEHGFETDTGYERIGDGATAFLSLGRRHGAYIHYDDYAAFKASTEGSRGIGAIWRYGPFSGVEVVSGDISNSATSPVQLDVLAGDDGKYNALAFDVKGDGVTDEVAAIVTAIGTGNRTLVFPKGYTYKISGPIACQSNLKLICGGDFELYEGASPFFFNVTGLSNVVFDGFDVDGRKASFVYAWNSGGTDSLNSRFRYAFVYGTSASNISVINSTFTDFYSAAIYLKGSLTSEEPDYTNALVQNCRYTDGYFELAKIVLMGDVKVLDNYTEFNTNTSGDNALLANGLVTNACSDVRIIGNYFGSCDGSGAKSESLNGPHIVANNTFELNDAQSLHFQESSIERGDVATRRESASVTGNTFKEPENYGVYGGSTSANAVRNVTVSNNVFEKCVAGGVYISADDWSVSDNIFIGMSKTRAGADTNCLGVLIKQENSNSIKTIKVTGNLFDFYNSAGGTGKPCVEIGQTGAVAFTVDNLLIANNIITDFNFRGFQLANEMDADNVVITGNIFNKTTNDGSSSRDIYGFNSTHELHWTISNNTVAQSIVMNLTHASSRIASFSNKVTVSENPDTANQYYVNHSGAVATMYDIGQRNAQLASAAPTTLEWRKGDIVWDSAPAAGGTMGWVCTTAGTPGTWKTFGAIAV